MAVHPQATTQSPSVTYCKGNERTPKAAILVFNRNKDFSKVLSAIPETVKVHPNFQKDEGKRGETAFRYAFRHKDDAAKILHLTIMAFDIPSPADEPRSTG